MSLCINPRCSRPENSGTLLFCQNCGSELLLEGRYQVVKFLGGGGFGKTYELRSDAAVKVLKVLTNNQPKAVELFQQEAMVLGHLRHPGIPSVEADGYFVFFPKDSPEPVHCLVMEKVEGLNLNEWLTQRDNRPIAEGLAVKWLRQILEILQQVHQQNYFHRDIKPPNIMLRPDGQLALIDFGTAREVTGTYMQKLSGQGVTGIVSTGYTPPEQMNGKAVPQSDFYALARTFVYLLTGKQPNEFLDDPRTGILLWRDSAPQISSHFADLIDSLMAPFPGNRPQDTRVILQALPSSNTSSGVMTSPPLEVIPPTVYQNAPQGQGLAPTFVQPSSQASQPVQDLSPSQEPVAPVVATPTYGGFGRRLVAYTLDNVILCIGSSLIATILEASLPTYQAEGGVGVFFGMTFGAVGVLISFAGSKSLAGKVLVIFGILLRWLYFSGFEASPLKGTLGKIIMGLVVTDSAGNSLSLVQASLRFWSKSLSTLTILIGFFMVAFTEKRQALHDIVVNTLVVRK